jgi:hypothetical protein
LAAKEPRNVVWTRRKVNKRRLVTWTKRRAHTKTRMILRAGMPDPGRFGPAFFGFAAAGLGAATAVVATAVVALAVVATAVEAVALAFEGVGAGAGGTTTDRLV